MNENSVMPTITGTLWRIRLMKYAATGTPYAGDANSSDIYARETSSSRHHPVRKVWKFLTRLVSPVRAGEKNSATP